MKRILSALLCLLLLLSVPGCFLLPAEETPPVLSVLDTETAETYQFSYVSRGDLEQWVSVTCRFQSLQQEHLRFQYDGRAVGEVYVEVGDDVEPGQLLAELENEELDEKLERAKAALDDLNEQLAFARTNLEIVSESWDLSNQQERYEETVAQLEEDQGIAALRVEELQAQKDKESIYAGIEGTVSYIRNYRVSDVESDYIIVSDRGDACFYADTEYYASMPAGMEVTLDTDEGSVQAVVTDAAELGFEDQGDEKRRRVYFVPTTPLATMTDSSRAQLDLLLDSRRDVLIVQARAVFFAGGQAYVYYENENGVREAKPIEIGLMTQNKYEVLSGLTEGEALIVG